MAHILILGGGAAGLAAALAAAQAAPAARVTVLERNPKVGKKLLATGNGRCNLDNTAIAPEKYFTADPAALRPLLAAVDAAAPLRPGGCTPIPIRRQTCWRCWSCICSGTPYSCAPAAR